MLNNAGKEGHIFEGKHKPLTNKDIIAMLGVYIIDGLAPSPQLTMKMQPQSKQPTHGNNKVASAIDVSQYSVRYEYVLWARPAKARR